MTGLLTGFSKKYTKLGKSETRINLEHISWFRKPYNLQFNKLQVIYVYETLLKAFKFSISTSVCKNNSRKVILNIDLTMNNM